MSYYDVPVVTIMTENGPVLINESDYVPGVHQLVDSDEPPVTPPVASEPPVTPPVAFPVASEPPVTPPVAFPVASEPPVTPPVASAVQAGISKEGAKWFVVDMNNNNEKICDVNGYPSKAKATIAAQALAAN